MANYRQIGLLIAILAIMAIVGYASVTTTYNDLGLSATGNYTLNSTGYVILNGDRGNNATDFNAKNITADNITVSDYVLNDSSKLKVSDEGLLVAINFNSDTVSGMNAYDVTGRGNNGSSNQQYLNNSGFNGGGCLNISNGSVSRGFNFSVNNPNLKFNYNDSFTMSIWVYPETRTLTYGVAYNPGVASMSFKYGFHIQSNLMSFAVRNTSMVGSTTSLVENEWQHYVGVYNASNRYVYLYRNGELRDSDDTGSENFTYPTAGSAFQLGGSIVGGNGISFNGSIDNFMVWNRTLTAEEIRSLYETRFEPSNNLIGKVIDVSTINSTTSTSNTYTAVQNVSGPSITGTNANITNINSTQSTSNTYTAVQNISSPVITGTNANITNINTSLLTLNELKGNNYTNISNVNNNTGYYTYYIHSEAEELIARSSLSTLKLFISNPGEIIFSPVGGALTAQARGDINISADSNDNVAAGVQEIIFSIGNKTHAAFKSRTGGEADLMIYGNATASNISANNISSAVITGTNLNVTNINSTQSTANKYTAVQNITSPVITGTNANITNINSTQSNTNKMNALNASVGDLWVGAGRIYHNGTHLVIQG